MNAIDGVEVSAQLATHRIVPGHQEQDLAVRIMAPDSRPDLSLGRPPRDLGRRGRGARGDRDHR